MCEGEKDALQNGSRQSLPVTSALRIPTVGTVCGELISDLVKNGERAGDGHRERARQVGFDLDGEFAVVVAQTDRERVHRLAFAASHLASLSGGIAGLHQDRAVLLLPGEDAGAAARRLAKELAVAIGQPVTVGCRGSGVGARACSCRARRVAAVS